MRRQERSRSWVRYAPDRSSISPTVSPGSVSPPHGSALPGKVHAPIAALPGARLYTCGAGIDERRQSSRKREALTVWSHEPGRRLIMSEQTFNNENLQARIAGKVIPADTELAP